MGSDPEQGQCGTASRRALSVGRLLGRWAHLGAGEHKDGEVHSRLANGVEELRLAADSVVARAGETVGACPNFRSGHRLSSA